MFPQVYGYHLWLVMYIGKVLVMKLLEIFVNAHGSPVIPPVLTSILRRGEQGHLHVFFLFSYCGC